MQYSREIADSVRGDAWRSFFCVVGRSPRLDEPNITSAVRHFTKEYLLSDVFVLSVLIYATGAFEPHWIHFRDLKLSIFT